MMNREKVASWRPWRRDYFQHATETISHSCQPFLHCTSRWTLSQKPWAGDILKITSCQIGVLCNPRLTRDLYISRISLSSWKFPLRRIVNCAPYMGLRFLRADKQNVHVDELSFQKFPNDPLRLFGEQRRKNILITQDFLIKFLIF